ncbi:MAG: RNA polymerase subunit sigma [Planctomycetaceae bacterium]
MGGPIVRTGTTPEFWKNWENVFGDKKKAAKKKTAAKAPQPAKKSGKKKAKSAKKSAGKK